MAIWSREGAVQGLLWLFGSFIILDTPFSPFRILSHSRITSDKLNVLIAFLVLYVLARFWSGQVTKLVPEPYLDEVFHVPQARAYCQGHYASYNPKLTTPPGLYAFAVLFSKIWYYGSCQVSDLRAFNVVALIMVMAYACDCRTLITRVWTRDHADPLMEMRRVYWMLEVRPKQSVPISFEALHTALNIALFPPLFFFSGLFYTDVLSTCLVLRAYRLFFERKSVYRNGSLDGFLPLYLTGIVALTMRQTNVFLVVVFLGALELVRNISPDDPSTINERLVWEDTVLSRLKQYARGHIYDIPLKDAGILDFILCPISIAVASSCHPILIIRLRPYIALLVSFAAFVIWNRGVVLGDKSNHVVTVHLLQMLYIWPLIAFFSTPLILPIGISFLKDLLALLKLPLFPRLIRQYVLVAIFTIVALVATLLIIKYNTIIHPFTLADNRHYMFYIFRYTILRHPLIRYLLAPVYLICGYLVYLTLCGPSKTQETKLKLENHAEGNTKSNVSGLSEYLVQGRSRKEQEGPKLSFAFILLVTCALSLITVPLVEPRYFILPWVIWRLNVPSLVQNPDAVSESVFKSREKDDVSDAGLAGKMLAGLKGYGCRLWLETAWFLLINAVTGYVFLYRGFEWKQEPGRVQRFMW